jgi:hypothetical protein
MSTDDGDTPAEGTAQEAPTQTPKTPPLANIPQVEQLMLLGSLLIFLVADLIGDVVLDKYSISRLMWLAAVVVLIAVWARRIANKELPVPHDATLTVVGYGGLLLGIRELLTDIESGLLEGGALPFALATYAGAALLGYGAYRAGRSD